MFGRRNPDQQPSSPVTPAHDTVELDLLADLPDLAAPVATAPIATAFERDWTSEPRLATTSVAAPQPPSDLPEPTPFVPTPPAATAFVPPPASTPAPTPSPAVAARPRSTSESIIGPDDFFDGSYRSERGVRIQGHAQGSIESRQYIFVEASADVSANLSADDITIAGSFEGTITCRHRLEITSTGKVSGRVSTALLVVQEGGLFDGELHMQAQRTAAEEAAAAAQGAEAER